MTGVPQSSVAATLGALRSHSGMLTGLQSSSELVGHLVKTGLVVSTVQVMCCTQVSVLPQPSVAVRVVVRGVGQPRTESALAQVMTGVPQSSVAATLAALRSQSGMLAGLQRRVAS